MLAPCIPQPSSSRRALLEKLDALEPAIGRTPVIPLRCEEDLELYAKLEFYNLTGSVKDRPAYRILADAVSRGELGPGATVIESSSGNFASSLVVMCKRLGLRSVVVTDPNMNATTRSFLDLGCDRVETVTTRDANGGYLCSRLRQVKALCREIPGAFWPNQYANPAAVWAHHQGTGAEIAALDLPLDYVFIGVSTGGTIAGISNRLKAARPSIKIVAVDVIGSTIFGGPSGARRIPGLGASVRSELVDQALIDDLVLVSEQETIQGCRELLARHGVFAGGSSGSVYAAIRRYFRRGSSRPPRVLFLCPDRGTAYLDTIYNHSWDPATGGHHASSSALGEPGRATPNLLHSALQSWRGLDQQTAG